MADIDIVPKHRNYTWLWVILAIIIIAIVWFAIAGSRGPTRTGSLLYPSPITDRSSLVESVSGA